MRAWLEAFGESGEATEVFRAAVESDLDTGVEDEVFVDLVGEAAGVVGLVAVFGDDADVFGVAAEFTDDGVTDDGSEEEFCFASGAVVDEVKLTLHAKADVVSECGGPGDDDSALPFVAAGRSGDVRHDGEGGVTIIISPEVIFEANGEVSKGGPIASGFGAKIENGLKIDIVSESGLQVELAINESFDTLITTVVEEGGFNLVAACIDRDGRFGGIGSVRREAPEEVIWSGVEEAVLGFIGRWAGRNAGDVDSVDGSDEILICSYFFTRAYPPAPCDKTAVAKPRLIWIIL